MSVGFLIVFYGEVVFVRGLVELSCVEIGILQIYSVVFLRYLDSLLYFGIALANSRIQIESLAILVKTFSFIHHA